MNKKLISILLTVTLFFVTSSITLAEASASANVENALVNVAIDKDISLIAGYEINNMYKEFLIDGKQETFAEVMWYTDVDPNVGYIIDLGKLYHVEELKLHALQTNASGRDTIWIDISANGSEWTNILTRDGRDGSVTDEFSSSQKKSHTLTVPVPDDSYIRYVKLSTWCYGVWPEFEIFASMPEVTDAIMIDKTICVNFTEEIEPSSVSCENLKLFAGETQITDYRYTVNGKTVKILLDEVLENVSYTIVPTSEIMSVYNDPVAASEDTQIPVVVQINVNSFELNKTSKTATAVANLQNNSDSSKTVTLFVAYYSSSGVLQNTALCTKELSANSSDDFEANLSSEVAFDDNSILRAYIWNMTDGIMAPVTGYKELMGNITELYVSPDGNDGYDGSINAPFKTIERAMEEVRLYNSDMTDDITVYLRDGTYQLDNTLTFTTEDSGTNGYEIVYKSYPGEEAVISGGMQVKEWTEGDDGIWYADVSGIDSALVMSVDGVAAKRAQSEEWIDIETLFPEERTISSEAGLTVADTKYAEYQNQSDIQLRFIRGWKSYLLNVESITVENNLSKFIMRQPTFYFAEYNNDSSGYEAHYYNIEDNNNFKIENAIEELDNPGEFCYSSGRIYYMPREGEILNSADVRVAKLDKLVEISGTDSANKVKNLAFEDITFSDGAWTRASEYGFVTDQAQTLMFDDCVPAKNPGYTVSPGNIHVQMADNIRFENNEIRNMGAVGISFYQGVDNSRIVGNAFYDIGDSAVTVSSPDQVYEEEEYVGRNLAAGKTVTAGSILGEYYAPTNILDTNPSTIWAPLDYNPNWIQVDLEAEYEIDRIEMDNRTDGGVQSFDGILLLASNDPEFNQYTELTSTQTVTDKGVVHTISNSEKFRYVRLKHNIDGAHWVLPELRIINESLDYVSSTDICGDNLINNNYITRVGKVNTAAPGMQLYYVKNTEISNNYVYEVPYSGIAVGWGWSMYKDSTTTADNSIINNRIDSAMLQAFDGGCIYMNGQQQGTVEISGNYVSKSINGGGIYLDSYSSNCNIENNVIEDTLEAFSSALDSFSNKWINNYSSSVLTSVNNLDYNDFVAPEYIIPGKYSQTVSDIVANAGLTDEYKDIVNKAGQNLDPLSVDEYYNNMIHDTDNDHISTSYLRTLYNTSFVNSCNEWIAIASSDLSNWSAISKLRSVVNSIVETDDRTVLFDQCDTLRKAMYEFIESIR